MDHPNYFLTRGDWDQLNSASSMETKMGVIADRLQAPVSYVARLSTRELQLHVRCVVRGVAPRRIRAVALCRCTGARAGQPVGQRLAPHLRYCVHVDGLR